MASPTKILNAHAHEFGAAYIVSQPAFEGPLDLLLHLINRHEMEITEISLMVVTENYLKTIAELEELEPGALADFLVVASRLLYIKSRALLPRPSKSDSEEDEEDPGDALIRQLIEYRQFKEIAASLKEREEQGLRVYLRMAPGPELERRLDLSNVDLDKLHNAVRKALQKIEQEPPPLPKVHTYPITVAEQIENVRNYIRNAHQLIKNRPIGDVTEPVRFVHLLTKVPDRMEVIVTFLAVLELIKQHELMAVQEDTFGEIVLLPFEPTPDPEEPVE